MIAAEGIKEIEGLVEAHEPGWCLAREFYNDEGIFARDLQCIFMRHWLFAGHVSRIPRYGDYFLFTIGKESISIIRGKDGGVHALFNVCRHRGSRICLEPSGNARSLVCPYHAWTYSTDGSLLAARAMPEAFDRAEFGLRKCHVRILEGMIYVNLSEEPPDFESFRRDAEVFLKPHGLAEAKIARSIVWKVEANWKLVVENFNECYHCGPTHPEYCSVMAHALPDTSGGEKAMRDFASLTKKWEASAAAMGHPVGKVTSPDMSYVCGRMPIQEGFLTQSADGKAVAPLMGGFAECDGGVTSCRMYPSNYVIACCDYAILPRFTPVSATHTEVEIAWLVHPDAVEGEDYDVEKLVWLWRVTTEQDKKIVEDNQAGVNSFAYRPGPYSKVEAGLTRFTAWYLQQLTPTRFP